MPPFTFFMNICCTLHTKKLAFIDSFVIGVAYLLFVSVVTRIFNNHKAFTWASSVCMLRFSKCFVFFLTWDLIKMTKEVIEGVWIHLNKENSIIFYVHNKSEIFDVLYFRKLEIAPMSLNKLFCSRLFLCAPSCSFLTWRAAFLCLNLSFHPYSEGSPLTFWYLFCFCGSLHFL